jgi:1-acyl-sn-glycerol-3-phosphate acyltransferase
MLLIFYLIVCFIVSSALYSVYLPTPNNWWYLLWVIAGLGTMIIMFILLTLLNLLIFRYTKPENKFKHWVLWEYVDFILLFLHVKIEVEGLENIPTDPVIIYGNHKSMLDPVILYYIYKKSMLSAVGKSTLNKVGFLRRLMRYMGCISINRDNDREAAKEMIKGIKRIKETGMGYIIFPEGGIKTRDTEEMVDVKPGAYKLSTKAEAAISPVSIIGTSKFIHMKFFGSNTCKVIIHKPILKEEYINLTTQELGDKVLDIVNTGVRNGK